MIGGFPVRILASVKIRSRLGVCRAEMQPVEIIASRTTTISPALLPMFVLKLTLGLREDACAPINTCAILESEKEVEDKIGARLKY